MTKTAYSEEKSGLEKHVEEAESKLEPVTQELRALKGHITAMCIAIFGRKSHNLRELPLAKLQVCYKFMGLPYIGGSKCVMAIKNTKAPPHYIMDMLNELSTVPEWISELKKAACRSGAMYALTRAHAYHPEMESALLAEGFPEFNTDNTPFMEKTIFVV